MRWHLAVAALRRHPLRTLLAVAGLAIAAALLLDMVMLATGMRRSFRSLLTSQGYQLRVAPKGTLPFDSEASVGGASEIVTFLRADPRVAAVSPTLGANVQVDGADGTAVSAFGLGLEADVQGDYELERGTDLPAPAAVDTARGAPLPAVVNAALLARSGIAIGDTVTLAEGRDAQLRAARGTRTIVVRGEARFLYVPPELPAVAVPLAAMRRLLGPDAADRMSMAMASVHDDADAEAVRSGLEARFARATAISTETAIKAVEERLAYFRQLAFILGAISLGIGVLLVTTLVSLSVQERLGELAVLRAIGVARGGVVQQVMLEGLLLGGAGIAGGLGLGLVTARWLNGILRDFPGLPAELDFFVWSGEAAWQALGLLLVAATLAGVWPAWRASRVRVAKALREEAVG